MKARLGINTCFAVKRWPRALDWIPVVNGLGLRLVQHSLDLVRDGATANDASALRRQAQDADIEVHSTFTGLAAYSANILLAPDEEERRAARRRFEWAIQYTAAMGGHATGGHVGAASVPDWHDRGRRAIVWEDLRRSLAALAQKARSAGLDYLIIENLAAVGEPSTIELVTDLLTDGDQEAVPIRLCLDVGHMCVDGTTGDDRNPYAWLRRLARVAPIVQLQQADSDGDSHWPFTPENNAQGRIDADRVIDALGEGGAETVDLIFEIIPPFEQNAQMVVDGLAVSTDYWMDVLVRRGVAAVDTA